MIGEYHIHFVVLYYAENCIRFDISLNLMHRQCVDVVRVHPFTNNEAIN